MFAVLAVLRMCEKVRVATRRRASGVVYVSRRLVQGNAAQGGTFVLCQESAGDTITDCTVRLSVSSGSDAMARTLGNSRKG